MSPADRRSLEVAEASLATLKKVMWIIAGANIVLGFMGEAGAGPLRTVFGFHVRSMFFWGVLYGFLSFILWHPRTLFAIAGLLVLEGSTVVMEAEDGGRSIPWLGLLLRIGFSVVAFRAFFLTRTVAGEREWADKIPHVARIPRKAGAPAPARDTIETATAEPTEPTTATPPAPVRPRELSAKRPVLLADAARSSMPPAVVINRIAAPAVSVDDLAASIRFVARRVEASPNGIEVVGSDGSVAAHPWSAVTGAWVRMLPSERPWSAQIVVDLTLASGLPIRLFSTTGVVFSGAPLPGSRLEQYRRLVAFVIEHAPHATVDAETKAFAGQNAPPGRLLRIDDLKARDAHYDPAPPGSR